MSLQQRNNLHVAGSDAIDAFLASLGLAA